MSVVEIDEKGRMTIPKRIGLSKTRAVVISVGSFLVVIPIDGYPYEVASSWLKIEQDVRAIKMAAEEKAAEDAVGRVKRRKQL